MTFALATVSCSGDKNGEKKDGDQRGKPSSANNKQSSNNNVPEARATDIKIKTIGWNIEEYDPATNKAGDMVFTKESFASDLIFTPYGLADIRSNDPTKINPQPVFFLPVGTNVLALGDGYINKLEKLYSGDYPIWIGSENATGKEELMYPAYEHEHLINPTVKLGDKVKAGDVIGTVSDYDTQNHPGFGTIEIGKLNMDGTHTCVFVDLDKSVKDKINKDLTSIMAGWETYLGKPNIYAQESYKDPGCATYDATR